jgi:alkanesulfonate monooxygenase SsuD/methylene tetrahydromethanopterin reductase-like flavin-dependent oxidoreductase (luciferase family)
MTAPLQFGLDTFGDVTRNAAGDMFPHAQVIRNVVDEAVLADELGLDFIGLGEHHRSDFAISSPETVLAAIASRTKRIHLGSAVTVLSSDDPIRVFQRFATLDALSGGRAEVILGRGSFTESFPLFGFDLRKYEELFEEKLDLFAALLSQEPVTWEGKLRPPLKAQLVYPPVENGRLKTWIAIGGSRRALRSAFDAGDHRRRSEAVRALRRSLSPRLQGVRPPGTADRRAFARLCRRDRRTGA